MLALCNQWLHDFLSTKMIGTNCSVSSSVIWELRHTWLATPVQGPLATACTFSHYITFKIRVSDEKLCGRGWRHSDPNLKWSIRHLGKPDRFFHPLNSMEIPCKLSCRRSCPVRSDRSKQPIFMSNKPHYCQLILLACYLPYHHLNLLQTTLVHWTTGKDKNCYPVLPPYLYLLLL